MKKVLSAIIALLICTVYSCAALAEDIGTENPFFTDSYFTETGNRIIYDFIEVESFSLTSPSSGKIKVVLKFGTDDIMEKIGFTSLKLQKWNGSIWTQEDEITSEYEYTTDYFNYSQSFTGLSSGYQYRVKVTLRAKRAPGEVQDLTITSDSIICH